MGVTGLVDLHDCWFDFLGHSGQVMLRCPILL